MTPEILAPVSVEEFWRLGHRWPKAELVAGQVVEIVRPGARHGAVVLLIGMHLNRFVTEHRMGIVFADAGFILSSDPPMVRAPDIAVVLTDRVPIPLPAGFFPGAPDLAVEVLSPDDRPAEVAAKVADYLRSGAQAVWVVNPDQQTLTVHTQGGAVRYGAEEVLRDAPPLPGLELPLKDLSA